MFIALIFLVNDRSVRSCPACKNQADNTMKLRIEQVGKGGLPPLFPDHLDWARAGVNHPSRLVQFKCLFFLPG